MTGPHQYGVVVGAVHAAVPPAHEPFLDLVSPQGTRLAPRHCAYLKISECCNHAWRSCIIPSMGGKLAEAERLVKAGVRGLLVISRATSAYGLDLGYAESAWRGRQVRAQLTELCRELGRCGGWVWLHYVYPYPHVDELIPLMAHGRSYA